MAYVSHSGGFNQYLAARIRDLFTPQECSCLCAQCVTRNTNPVMIGRAIAVKQISDWLRHNMQQEYEMYQPTDPCEGNKNE